MCVNPKRRNDGIGLRCWIQHPSPTPIDCLSTISKDNYCFFLFGLSGFSAYYQLLTPYPVFS